MWGKYNAFTLIRLAFLFLLPSMAMAGPSRCFLHGMISPIDDNKEKISLTNMIRMRFDADDQKKCARMIKSYCVYNVKGKSYSPVKLVGSFMEDVDKGEETIYSFTPSCGMQEKD